MLTPDLSFLVGVASIQPYFFANFKSKATHVAKFEQDFEFPAIPRAFKVMTEPTEF